MTSILIQAAGAPPTERQLKPGTVTIGRRSDNDFCLEHATVSGYHAKIVTYFQSSYIEDLGSTNGTQVNGRRVRMHTLHPGDVITIGKFELRFGVKAPAQTPPAPRDTDATMVMSALPSSAARAEALVSPKPAPDAATAADAACEPPRSAPADKVPEAASGAASPQVSDTAQPSASPAPEIAQDPSPSAYFQVMVGEGAGARRPVHHAGLELSPGVRVIREGDVYVVRRGEGPVHAKIRLNSRDLDLGGTVLKDMDMLQVDSTWMAFFHS